MDHSSSSVTNSLKSLLRSKLVSIENGFNLKQTVFEASRLHRQFDERALTLSSTSELILSEAEHSITVAMFDKAFEFSLLYGALAVKGGRVFLTAQRNRAGVLEVSWADCARYLSQKSRRKYLEDIFQHSSEAALEEFSGQELLITHFGVIIRDVIVA